MTAMSVTLAPRPHLGEGLVARRIEERDRPAAMLHAPGADHLRDAARFGGHDVALADLVQERRFAMIDVAHDGYDRRPRQKVFRVVRLLGLRDILSFGVLRPFDVQLAARLGRHHLGHVGFDGGVDGDGRRQAVAHQLEEQFAGTLADGFGQRADGDREVDRHFALAGLGRAFDFHLLRLESDARAVVVQQADASALDVGFHLGLARLLTEVARGVAGVAAGHAAGAALGAGAFLLVGAAFFVVDDLFRHDRRCRRGGPAAAAG